MKVIKFAENLVPLILSGEKTSTWRLFDDKNLQVGDEFEFVNKQTGEKFASAIATDVRVKHVAEIDETDFADGHERYESVEELVKTFQTYYGDQVDENTEVKIVKFILIS
jgi:hypothetical protein